MAEGGGADSSTACTPEQQAKVAFPFESDERLRWHFIPNEMFPRKGLMIKDMNETQRRLAHDLLRSGLSARGYLKVTSIIELEDILKVIETGGKFARNKEEYLFSIFGTPAAKGRWGWRVEGHHISRALRRRRRRRDRQRRHARRCSSDPIRPKSGKATRKGCASSPTKRTPARALVMALPRRTCRSRRSSTRSRPATS